MKKYPKGHKPGCLCRACKGVRGELEVSEQLGIRISPELSRALRERATESGETITEITVQALVAWLEK